MSMFQFDPFSKDPFIRNGSSTGGSWSSAVNGIARTKDELLNHASSYPAPNEKKSSPIVSDQLIKLHNRYHNPSWHQHYCVTGSKGEPEENEEIVQNLPSGD